MCSSGHEENFGDCEVYDCTERSRGRGTITLKWPWTLSE